MNRVQKIAAYCELILASVAVCVINYRSRRIRRNRRYKVRPMNRQRRNEGQYYTLVKKMLTVEVDYEQYFKYTRMTPNMFRYLLELVGPKLQKDKRGGSLSPDHRLLMTLHYLAEECSMQEIARGFRVGKTTIHVIITETTQVLWDILMRIVLPIPSSEAWKDIVKGTWREVSCNLRSVGRLGANNATRGAIEARNNLANYFVSNEGSVPWQWDYILKGSLPE
ncbi:hypothetical protein NQ314_021421 [Rhamnusium bicolor]|uniref:Transposase Helix-turn-helix domain-containing protein n=1 Tax=Rhamnusium bicolor TaxID=1586634 RepID=A0AAV8WIP6_9CUCU|nr:hypothetical protein NQ314_021421 [Rhamnusium bicolor]